MALSPEHRAKLQAESREATVAFVKDMPHIRGVSRAGPIGAELSLLSNVLCRLLIDKGRTVTDLAAPRTGRMLLVAPDNKPIYRSGKKQPFAFFGSAGVRMYGFTIRAGMVEHGTKSRELENFDPGRTIQLKMDSFLSQNVLCLGGVWISRRAVLKYVGDIGRAHSDTPQDHNDRVLDRVRRLVSYSIQGSAVSVTLHKDLFGAGELPFRETREAIDPVLLELLATAHFLAISPDLEDLEKVIQNELHR
jgi:hypothetical protein